MVAKKSRVLELLREGQYLEKWYHEKTYCIYDASISKTLSVRAKTAESIIKDLNLWQRNLTCASKFSLKQDVI